MPRLVDDEIFLSGIHVALETGTGNELRDLESYTTTWMRRALCILIDDYYYITITLPLDSLKLTKILPKNLCVRGLDSDS
jgi:hypothetical protein